MPTGPYPQSRTFGAQHQSIVIPAFLLGFHAPIVLYCIVRSCIWSFCMQYIHHNAMGCAGAVQALRVPANSQETRNYLGRPIRNTIISLITCAIHRGRPRTPRHTVKKHKTLCGDYSVGCLWWHSCTLGRGRGFAAVPDCGAIFGS